MAKKRIIIVDPSKCCVCGRCQYACAFSHEQVFNLALSRMALMRMSDNVTASPMVCQQCTIPYCTFACPAGAIIKNKETGIVFIDMDCCVGCLQCFMACPFGGITVSKECLPFKCDQCEGEPECVLACKYNAITYVDLDVAVESKSKHENELLANKSE